MIKRTLALATVLLAAAFLSAAAQAAFVDLTGNNNSGTINNGIFSFADQQPTGTGVIDPFPPCRELAHQQGYNTLGGTPFDDKAGPWTHDIQISDLRNSIRNINGTQYFTLLLDVNEPNAQSLISLDSLSFYTSSIGSQTTTNINQLGTLRWSLDGAGNSYVLLDAARITEAAGRSMHTLHSRFRLRRCKRQRLRLHVHSFWRSNVGRRDERRRF